VRGVHASSSRRAITARRSLIVACNDDLSGFRTTTDVSDSHRGSWVTPNVTAGHTYFTFVDGYASNSGNFLLMVIPPP